MSNQLTIHEEPKALESLERAPATIYEVLGSLARDPAIDVTRIAALMDIQIKAEDRQAEKEFNAAFARLQPILPRIVKHGVIDMGTKGKMNFARYEDLDAAIRPLYVGEGFSLSFISEPTPSGIILVAVLAHSAGHHKESRLQLPADPGAGRNNLQALGSSLSYAKRYLTCDIFNIVTVGEDNDGTSISAIDEKQRDNIEDLIHEIGEEHRVKMLEFVGYKSVGEIQKGAYHAVIQYLLAKRRQLAERSK